MVQRSVVESSNAKREQVSSEQEAQKQFVTPGGPMNISSSPPSQTHAAHMVYGEGSQLGAQRKLQIEVQFSNNIFYFHFQF